MLGISNPFNKPAIATHAHQHHMYSCRNQSLAGLVATSIDSRACGCYMYMLLMNVD